MAPELEERFYETQRAQLLRWLPWLNLFRAFRIALDGRKILLGTLAAIALSAGDIAINALPFAPAGHFAPPRSSVYVHDTSLQVFGVQLGVESVPLTEAPDEIDRWPRVLQPLLTLVPPGAHLFQRGNSWADAAFDWTQLLFRLSVWSLLGGAIARMAAVQFARRESVTARVAVQYSAARFTSTIGAPLLPLVFIGGFWIVCLLFGLVGRIPGVGPSIVGALWFIPLLVGIALAVIVLVIAASWPLMVATISAEGTDAFDALSRGYDYLLNRTWYALWLLILAVVYGTIVLAFVELVANYAVELANWGVGSGMGAEQVGELAATGPLRLGDPMPWALTEPGGFAATATSCWLKAFAWLLQGFVISYFWTAITIIYFLLRLSLDAKPLDEAYVPSAERPQELPLVGIPASKRREQERGEAAGDPPDTANGGDAPPSSNG